MAHAILLLQESAFHMACNGVAAVSLPKTLALHHQSPEERCCDA